MVPGYHVRCCCFPDLSHVNIQGVKTHTVGNYSNWNYKLNLTQCDFFTCVYPTLYRHKHMYCIYFYANHGIDLGSVYLLEVKDLKDFFPTMFDTMLT